MLPPPTTSRLIRFATFEVDFKSGELRKNGLRIKLQEQPLRALAMLVENPGKVVPREELRQALWSADTFVDFEHGLNKAINKIREALGDTPENPRFIETLPRHGYRFIAHVETVVSGVEALQPSITTPPPVSGAAIDDPRPSCETETGGTVRRHSVRSRTALAAGFIVAALVAILVFFNVAGLRDRLLSRYAAPPKIQSIAVLPLENLSRDSEQEYFADGMTDEIITNLAKIRSLRVISRTSVMQYKGAKKPLAQIARELNVDAVVEGSVLRSENRVRITAQLIQAKPEKHL